MCESQGSQPESAHQLAPGVWVRPADLHFTAVRSGGPGGQAVNKLSTQVQMRLAVEAIEGLSDRQRQRLRKLAGQRLTSGDELLFQAQTHRSQLDNRRACLQRLSDLVVEAITEPKPRKKSKPSAGAIRRRREARQREAEKKARRRWKPDP